MPMYSGFGTDPNKTVDDARLYLKKQKSVSTTPTRQKVIAAGNPAKAPDPAKPKSRRVAPAETAYIRKQANTALWQGDPLEAMRLDADADQQDANRDGYLYRQAFAGAALPLSNSAPEGQGYVPTVIPMVPAFVNDVGQLLSKNSTQNPDSFLQKSSEAFQRGNDRTNEFFGVENPMDTAEMAANIGGSMIIPAKVPKFKGVGPVSKVLAGAGNVAVETLIPFRQQNFFSPTTAISAGLGMGIMEGVDLGFNTEYNSFVDQAQALLPKARVSPDASVVPKVTQINNEAPNNSDQFEPGSMEAYLNQETSTSQNQTAEPGSMEAYLGTDKQQEPQEPQQEEKVPIWRDPLKMGLIAGTLALGAGAVVQRQAIKSKLAAGTSLAGLTEAPQVTSNLGGLVGRAVQGDQAVREAFTKIHPGDKQAIKMRNAELDGYTNPALNTKVTRVILSGELPNSQIQIPSPAVFMEAFAQELTDAQKAKYSDAVLAATALDDYKFGGPMPSFQSAVTGKTAQSVSDLRQMVFDGTSDPVIKKYIDMNRQIQDGILDYKVEQNVLTAAARAEMKANRPNYTHMSKNEIGGPTRSGDMSHLMSTSSRSTEDMGGIAAGAAVDPMRDLPTVLTSIVRSVEVNNFKRKFIQEAIVVPDLKKGIKVYKKGQKPTDMTGVHNYVDANGEHFVKITDQSLDTALKFSPPMYDDWILNNTAKLTSLAKYMTTGPGNPKFGLWAMSYDTFMGILTRPKEIDAGVLSDLINAMGNPGVLKPLKYADNFMSGWLAAPVGAIRLAGDELIGNAGRSMGVRLLKENDIIVDLVGRQNAQAFADWVTHVYDKSISVKADMDRTGAFSSGNFANSRTDDITDSIADMAPNYFSDQAILSHAEALASATTSDITKFSKLVNRYGSQGRALAVTRAYLGAVRLMHEGYRYQIFAANRTKVARGSAEEMLLASQVRRISADVLQRGNDVSIKKIDDQVMYMNAAIQGLTHLFRRFKDNPVETFMNVSIGLSSALAISYLSLANDDDLLAQWNGMTDEQKMKSMPSPFGMVGVPGEARTPWAIGTAILDQATGASTGQISPEWTKSLNSIITGEEPLDYMTEYSLGERTKAALWGMSPINPGSSPMFNAGMAGAFGVDMGFSKFSEGTVGTIPTQQISGLDTDKSLVGDVISAKHLKMIQGIGGSVGSEMIRAGADYFRVLSQEKDMGKAWNAFAERMEDNTKKQSDPITTSLFPDYVKKKTFSTPEASLYYRNVKGLNELADAFRKDVVNPYQTGSNPKTAMPNEIDVVPPDLSGTKLAFVGSVARELISNIRDYSLRENQLQNVTERLENNYVTSREERNRRINEINEERKQLIKMQNDMIRDAEDTIGEMIGDPKFTFRSIRPDDLLTPMPPLN